MRYLRRFSSTGRDVPFSVKTLLKVSRIKNLVVLEIQRKLREVLELHEHGSRTFLDTHTMFLMDSASLSLAGM
jgi:hypothetical protein